MTLPKLLFALGQKGVALSEGKGGRLRFNPRGLVSPAMKAAIQEHKPAILALLRGEDLDDWRMVRLCPSNLDDRPNEDDEPGQWVELEPEWSEDELEMVRQAAIEDQGQALPWESGSG